VEVRSGLVGISAVVIGYDIQGEIMHRKKMRLLNLSSSLHSLVLAEQ
jgi:hypothetical protein